MPLTRPVGPTSLARSMISLPTLVCASDGNHGLAVAAAAQLAGASARIYLHGNAKSVSELRDAVEAGVGSDWLSAK